MGSSPPSPMSSRAGTLRPSSVAGVPPPAAVSGAPAAGVDPSTMNDVQVAVKTPGAQQTDAASRRPANTLNAAAEVL